MNAENASISTSQAWILAFRPKTLPAAASPVLVGSAVAFYTGRFSLLPALAALVGALLLQIGANLANDVYDFQRGVDTSYRVGPLRVTQAGLLTPDQVKAGMWLVFGLATLIGVYLTVIAGWPVIFLGVLAIAAAIAYTGGPFPLGYHGLGEVFVFVFFGLVAVTGTYFVQALEINWYALAASIPVGLLTCALLTVNNLRDIETDRISGKMTLAARFGENFARQEYLLLISLAYLTTFLMAMTNVIEPWVVLTWLSLPMLFPLGKMILTMRGHPLNQALAMTGRLELIFSLLFSLGLILARYFKI